MPLQVAGQNVPQLKSSLQRLTTSAWRFLRSPRLTAGSVAAIIVVGIIGWFLPQQAAPSPDEASWIASLPIWLQPWGEPLFFLGFARLFQSIWFWGALALLMLNSLIALADYGPGSWQRLGQSVPPITWQHPLAFRGEHVVRLPTSPDEFLDRLQSALADQGFFIYQRDEAGERLVGAVRRRRAWLGPLAMYLGFVLLVAAFLLSHYYSQTERLTLLPLEAMTSELLAGQFELGAVEAGQPLNQIAFSSAQGDQAQWLLRWPLFLPAWFQNTLVMPIASEPVLTVEARDAGGELRRLLPIQEELPPAERLNLPLTGPDEPLYFLIPSARLALQIVPDSASAGEEYNVQVRRGSEATPSEERTVQAGRSFELDGLSISLSLNRDLQVIARRDPGLPLYLIGILLLLLGSMFTWVWPPRQLWLAPEVKGMGGQLYGVAEKIGSPEREAEFLAQLLAPEPEEKLDQTPSIPPKRGEV